MKTTTHPAAARYLRDLERALRDVPGPRRREIVEEIQEHIEEAISTAPGDAGELHIRTVLDQLGDPETIAEEARERLGIARAKAGILEGAAITLLLIGALLVPLIGWIIGAVLLWISRVWTRRDKLIGTLLVPGGLATPLFFSFFAIEIEASSSCEMEVTPAGTSLLVCETTDPQLWGPVLLVLLALLVVVPIGTAIYLGRRAFRR